MKTAQKYDRRLFLKGLGAGVGMLPMLEGEWAKAAGVPAPPRRFMSFVITNGMPVNKFFPTGTGADYTMSETAAPLEPVRSKITFVQGLQFRSMIDVPFSVAGHHNLGGVLTGMPLQAYSDPKSISNAGGPSMDQHIVAQARLANPAEGRPILIAYQPTARPQTSWKGPGAPESAEPDLYKLFNTLFMGAASAPLVAPADLARIRAARKSLLDVVGKDIERFCKNLGTDDLARCNSHLGSFREIEKSLGMTMQPGNSPIAPPTMQASFSSTNNADMPKYMEALVKLVTAAFASNKSRAINFTFGDSIGDSLSYPHLGFPKVAGVSIYDGGSGVDHGEAHNNTKTHMAARKWLLGELTKLIQAMDKVMENNGRSLLDNSVIYMTTNMSTGGSHDVGRGIDMPTLIAGSCGGYLKMGVAVKLPPPRVAVNRLFHSILGAMAIDPKGFDGGRYGTELGEVRAGA